MKKITKLSPEQIARIPEWVERWLAVGLSTEPANFDAADQAVRNCYALCKLPPPKVVLRMSSPFGAVLGGVLAEALIGHSGTVEQQVEQQVRQQVWQQVRQQVGQQVEQQVGSRWSEYRGGQLWASWYAYVSFFRDVCGWENEALLPYANDEILAQSASWTWWAPEVAAISDRPETLHRDEQGRLHSTTEATLKYRDGWAIHAVHGVRVPADIIEDRASITVARIESEQNAEVRRVMIDLYGPKRYLADSGANVVHELPADHAIVGLRTARLLRKEVPDDEPIIMVDLLNSSPEPDGSIKRYLLRVDPNAYGGEAARDCLAAAASTWRMSDGALAFKRPQDYAPMFES